MLTEIEIAKIPDDKLFKTRRIVCTTHHKHAKLNIEPSHITQSYTVTSPLVDHAHRLYAVRHVDSSAQIDQ